MSSSASPVAVEVFRGGLLESQHRVNAIVIDAHERIVATAGDIGQRVFPRSSIKPFQAVPLIETGAGEAISLSPEELALACASHGGEPMHVDRVRAWLKRIDLAINDLGCGPHRPSHGASAALLARSGQEPDRTHNNCSGKHTGMLSTARHMGEPIQT